MERWPSGLRCTPGQCVYVNSVSRVRQIVRIDDLHVAEGNASRAKYMDVLSESLSLQRIALLNWARYISHKFVI